MRPGSASRRMQALRQASTMTSVGRSGCRERREPDALHRVELGVGGQQDDEGDVLRGGKVAGDVPADAIEPDDAMN